MQNRKIGKTPPEAGPIPCMKRPWRTQVLTHLTRLQRFATRPWYVAAIAGLAALDAFVVFIPVEALMFPAVLTRRSRWLGTTLWISLGSAIGATLFGLFCREYGTPFLHALFPELLGSRSWQDMERTIQAHGGWGLALVSLSFLPQHPAVAFAGLAHLPLRTIFLAVLAGRALKYLVLSWAVIRFPRRGSRFLPSR